MKKKVLLSIVSIVLICSCCLFIMSCSDKGEEEISLGVFYSLKEAYSKKILTNEDLRKISYYYCQWESVDNKKDTLSISLLKDNQQKQIKNSYLLNVLNDNTISEDYVKLYAYYGTYNGAIAVGITDSYYAYDLLIIPEYVVGEVTFYNFSESEIRIWVETPDIKWFLARSNYEKK